MNEINDSNANDERPKKRKLLPLPKNQTDHPLAFDPSQHDQKIEARMSEEAKSKCRAVISRAYAVWKKNLTRRIDKALLNPKDAKKQLTQQHIIASLYELHGIVAKEADTPEMFEWRSFTMDLLEDAIGTIVMTQLKKNLFTEFIPEIKGTDALVIPQRHAFETLAEFEAIPFIQKFRGQEGFVGFLREQKQILGLFNDGEVVRVGIVSSPKGVEKLPTRLQMMKELERSEQ